MILDTTKRRTLTRPLRAIVVVLASGLALAVATAYSPPRSLMAAITSGGSSSDTPAHSAAEAAYLQAQIQRFGDKDPWAGKAYYMLGTAQVGAGRIDAALASFDKAIVLPEPPYPNSGIHSSARYERINSLDSPGHYAEAVLETQKLLKNGGRGLISADLEENLRERLPEFKLLPGLCRQTSPSKILLRRLSNPHRSALDSDTSERSDRAGGRLPEGYRKPAHRLDTGGAVSGTGPV